MYSHHECLKTSTLLKAWALICLCLSWMQLSLSPTRGGSFLSFWTKTWLTYFIYLLWSFIIHWLRSCDYIFGFECNVSQKCAWVLLCCMRVCVAAGVGRTNCYCCVVCVSAWLLAWGVPTVIVVLHACVRGCWCGRTLCYCCVVCVCAWMLVWAYPLYAAQVVQAIRPVTEHALLHGEAGLQGLGWGPPADPWPLQGRGLWTATVALSQVLQHPAERGAPTDRLLVWLSRNHESYCVWAQVKAMGCRSADSLVRSTLLLL